MTTQTVSRTTNPIEDISDPNVHPFVMQARNFLGGNSHPKAYYKAVVESLPKVHGSPGGEAMKLLGQIEMKYCQLIQEELDAITEDRTEKKNSKATKPSELWRKYHDDLYTIFNRHGGTAAVLAMGIIQELHADLTLSENNLASPEHIDAYTGEAIHEIITIDMLLDENRHNVSSVDNGHLLLLKAIFFEEGDSDIKGVAPLEMVSKSAKEMRLAAERCREDLKWDEETTIKFLSAQKDYDADSDDIPLPDDDTDDYTPPTLLPNELVLNRELWFTSRNAINAFNRERSRIFKHMKLDGIKPREWHFSWRNRIQNKPCWQNLLDTIERIANEDLVTGAALYLSLAGDYGVMEEDVCHLDGKHLQTDSRMNLIEYAAAWEDDLISLTQDSLNRGFPMSEKQLERFDILLDQTVMRDGKKEVVPAKYRLSMPKYHHNPVQTASWNIGYARAAASGNTTWAQAEEAAWDNWRLEMDEKAAQSYNVVYAAENDRSKAMAAFWKACDPRVPRPQSRISYISSQKDGLVISAASKPVDKLEDKDYRRIDWNVARLKLINDELLIEGDTRERLLKALKQLECGQQIWKYLEIMIPFDICDEFELYDDYLLMETMGYAEEMGWTLHAKLLRREFERRYPPVPVMVAAPKAEVQAHNLF